MSPASLTEPMAAVVLGSGATLAAASLTGDQIDTIKLVAGAVLAIVSATVGAIAWHRRETRAAIKAHERVEQERDERRHEEVMGTLRMLVQRLVDRGVLPEASPSGSWPIMTPAPIRPRRDDDTGEG